jgi:hypothetical protein
MRKIFLHAMSILWIGVSISALNGVMETPMLDNEKAREWLEQNPIRSQFRDGKLYVVGYSADNNKWVEGTLKCPVCQEDYNVGGPIALCPCGYVMCFKCYCKKATDEETCPSCKSPIPNDNVILRSIPRPLPPKPTIKPPTPPTMISTHLGSQASAKTKPQRPMMPPPMPPSSEPSPSTVEDEDPEAFYSIKDDNDWQKPVTEAPKSPTMQQPQASETPRKYIPQSSTDLPLPQIKYFFDGKDAAKEKVEVSEGQFAQGAVSIEVPGGVGECSSNPKNVVNTCAIKMLEDEDNRLYPGQNIWLILHKENGKYVVGSVCCRWCKKIKNNVGTCLSCQELGDKVVRVQIPQREKIEVRLKKKN